MRTVCGDRERTFQQCAGASNYAASTIRENVVIVSVSLVNKFQNRLDNAAREK